MRIMTWNVRRWDEFSTKKNQSASPGHVGIGGQAKCRLALFPGILEPADTAKSNIRYISNRLGFPYYFFSRDYRSPGKKYETGVIIFSKYPIVARIQTHFNKDTLQKTESLIAADINVNGQIIRIFTTHLQSVLFKSKDFRSVEILQNAEDSMLEASRSLAKKLKNALGLRGYQADTVRKQLDTCSYPLVICGDFNDVPNSYSYFHIRGNLQDAFIAKCFGIGRSYKQISPTLRIDYILPSREFQVVQTMKLSSPYSDHNAMLTDLKLQERKR